MRITCPHCTTDYHAEFLGLAKRGSQDRHAVMCVCGKSFDVTFEEVTKVDGKNWWERWKNRKAPKVQLIANVTPAED